MERLKRHPADVLRDDHYSPQELADLLDMDCHFIRQEVFCGRLHAFVCDHHIQSIRREDVLRWLEERGAGAARAASRAATGQPGA